MPKLDPETNKEIREGAEYAIATLDGELITDWATPDEDGELSFDFSADVVDFEIWMRLADGTTIVKGEQTHIDIIEEEDA